MTDRVRSHGAPWSFGFLLRCPWRIEFGRQFEYWRRYQFGPFYALHHVSSRQTRAQALRLVRQRRGQ